MREVMLPHAFGQLVADCHRAMEHVGEHRFALTGELQRASLITKWRFNGLPDLRFVHVVAITA